MTDAYAECACINRSANLARQIQVTKMGQYLLIAVVVLGLQGLSYIIYSQRHGQQPEQLVTKATATNSTTTATNSTTAATHRDDQSK